MPKLLTQSLCALTLVGCFASAQSRPPRPAHLALDAAQPPAAKKEPRETVLHGERLVDDYAWMRKKGSPEVEQHLRAENAYTDAAMKPTEALQRALYDEMLGRLEETDLEVPYQRGPYLYYSRTEKGKQYPIHCRKQGSLQAPEQIVLDPNELARGKKFLSVGDLEVNDDQQLLAYSTDEAGFRQYTLHVVDLRTGKVFPETMERVTSVAWAADGATLFYSVEDPVAKRDHRVYRHALGTPADQDALIYEEKDERFRVRVARTRSKAFVLMTIRSHTTSEVRFLRADDPRGAFRTIAPREQDHEYYADHGGDVFYIRTNSGGRNFRVVTAPVSNPSRESWKELVPHRDEALIEDLDAFATFVVLTERQDAVRGLRIVDPASGASHRVEMQEPAYQARLGDNEEFAARALRFEYESNVTPKSVFDYDVTSRKSTLRKQLVVKGYDPSRYAAERTWATAPDGARVPVSLVYRRDTPRDGTAPLLLTGYGAYGISMRIAFSSEAVSLLDRGFVLAAAHIRGGGDLGKKWHDQGRMFHKRNTFTDFIACAEHLIAQRTTSRDRLAIVGGSAGGLLMGAVLNLRPDLFRAAVALVPFVDVINTMSDASLPETVEEYEEWGNPMVEDQYRYIRSYSPYENVAAKEYPAILVKSAYNDSQVMYWEPAKWVARLRATKADRNPLLLSMDMEPAGHGGKSGRYDRLHERAFIYAFLLSVLPGK